MKKLILDLMQPALFILIGVTARILPHPANFTPIAGIGLLGGTYLSKRQAFSTMLITMLISDTILGFDGIISRVTVYGCLAVTTLIGVWLKSHKNAVSILSASLISSVIFFLITNASVWAFGTMYSKNLSGLIESYILAVPFFRNSVAGDLFYTILLFGAFDLIANLIHKNKFAWSINKKY